MVLKSRFGTYTLRCLFLRRGNRQLNRSLRIALVLVLWLATLGALLLWLTSGEQARLTLGAGPALFRLGRLSNP